MADRMRIDLDALCPDLRPSTLPDRAPRCYDEELMPAVTFPEAPGPGRKASPKHFESPEAKARRERANAKKREWNRRDRERRAREQGRT